MRRKSDSLVLVVRLWHDDDGVRAVLQTTSRSGETPYASVAGLRRALGEVLDAWQAAAPEDADVRRLGRD